MLTPQADTLIRHAVPTTERVQPDLCRPLPARMTGEAGKDPTTKVVPFATNGEPDGEGDTEVRGEVVVDPATIAPPAMKLPLPVPPWGTVSSVAAATHPKNNRVNRTPLQKPFMVPPK